MQRPRAATRVLTPILSLLLIFGLVAPAGAQSDPPAPKGSTGTEFWIAFPGNYDNTPPVLFISGASATQGTVAMPGISWSTDFTVVPGDVTTVVLPAAAQVQETDGTTNVGIRVTAAAPVSVYGLNQVPFTTDAYLAYPVDALGTDHLVLAYTPSAGAQVTVVAAQPDTSVTITPSVTAGPRTAGVPYTVALDPGQVYQLRTTAGDLTGTRVESNHPVAVFGGDRCATIPAGYSACDHIVQQLPPVTAWGTGFATMPLLRRTGGDTFRVLASEDGTEVRRDGELVATLARGAFHEMRLTTPARIVTSAPALVAQYANGISFDSTIGDPFMMLVPPTEQFQNAYTVTTPATGFATHHLNLVVPEIGVGTIVHNGTTLPAEEYVPIGDGFHGVRLTIEAGVQNLHSPHPFGVAVYGWNQADSYGYMGGSGFSPVGTVRSLELDLGGGPVAAPVDGRFCLPVVLRDADGAGVVGVRVDYTVSGTNDRIGFAHTDRYGYAEFCYEGEEPGTDVVTAKVGQFEDGVTVTWTTDPLPPGRPGGLGAEPHDGGLTLSWDEPTTGGSPITGYTLEWRALGEDTWQTRPVSGPDHALDGLDNGTTYEVRLRATNAVGDGLWSATIRAVPEQRPGQPKAVTVTAGPGTLALTWEEADDGVPVTGYRVRWRAAGSTTWESVIVTGTGHTITGLPLGVAHDVQVAAIGTNGVGAASSTTGATPADRPAAVGTVAIVPGDGRLVVSWDAAEANGSALTGYVVRWREAGTGDWTSTTVTGRTHAIDGLANGTTYEVEVVAHNSIGTGPATSTAAAPVPLPPGAPGNVKLTPVAGGVTVTWQAPSPAGATPLTGYTVEWRTGDGSWQTAEVTTSPYTLTGLPGGVYEVRVTATNAIGTGIASQTMTVTVQPKAEPPAPTPVPGKPGPATPAPTKPAPSKPTPAPTKPPAQEPPAGTGVQRVRGAERTSTAAELSASTFAPGVPVVYIVHQDRFADALTGGPAAALEGGPILLVGADGLPAATIAELERLRPGRIVVLGGTAAVPASVAEALEAYTDGEVARIAGTDRYATSAALSRSAFAPGVETVYVATGEGFADSLSGGPAAADDAAPILLTAPGSIPASVREELVRLAPGRIVVLGGSAAVSTEVERELAALTEGAVTRIGGRDRFETSARVTATAFPEGLDTVYIATGSAFPDALAATPVAHAHRAGVLLVHRDAIPAAVEAELARLAPKRIVVLGGTGAVDASVAKRLEAFVAR